MKKSNGSKSPGRKRSKAPKPPSALDLTVRAETLERLIARLGIAKWDYLVVGDGSGSTWDRGAGWGSVVVERDTDVRTVFGGAVNRGTVNFGEIMAALQPLEFLASREYQRRKASGRTRTVYVHVLTDS